MSVWLVAREHQYSPGRIADDKLILDAVAKQITLRGIEFCLLSADQLTSALDNAGPPTLVLAMCEGRHAVANLRHLVELGAEVINSPISIATASQRARMIASIKQSGLPFPCSRLVSTEIPAQIWPFGSLWVKRADYHYQERGDVSFVRTASELEKRVAELRVRGIQSVILQDHYEGEVIKCYVIGDDLIYGYGQSVTYAKEIEEFAIRAGKSMELDVYGVDILLGNSGPLVLDVNDWPSFAPCRSLAAERIVSLALSRIRSKGVSQ